MWSLGADVISDRTTVPPTPYLAVDDDRPPTRVAVAAASPPVDPRFSVSFHAIASCALRARVRVFKVVHAL